MVGKVLKSSQGICHDLFRAGGAAEEEEGEEKPEEEEGDKKVEVVDKTDILNNYPHKFVPEVVREKKIHYWQVPRLGSFMAIPLIYKSCLHEMALDKALTDYI
jgi:hypothetical protein